MAKLTRKCKVCGKEFNIFDNDYVTFRGGFTEVNCYKEYKLSKGNSSEFIEVELNNLLSISRNEKKIRLEKQIDESNKKIQAKKKEVSRKENLDLLIKYIFETYQISNLPTYFYTKLAQINNGTYKGMNSGIPYVDLLDMFKRKQSYLDKIAYNNNQKYGKGITGVARINYDIAILINKYDEYLSWKNTQNILSVEHKEAIEVEGNKVKIDYSKAKKSNKSDDIDISDILEDIF